MLIRRPAICRPRTRMRSAIGRVSGQARSPIPRGCHPCGSPAQARADQTDRVAFGLAGPAWCAARDGQLLGLFRRLQTSYEQDFSPAGRGQSPWCESDRGRTLQADGGNHDRGHDGNFRCDTHWCRSCCPCISGDHHCGGGGLVYPGFPLNVGAQLGRMVAPSGADAGFTGQAQDGNGQVAQAGHDAEAVASADMGTLLIPVHVADPVQSALD